MKGITYFIQAPLNVDSLDSTLSTALKVGYEAKKKTFVYLPFKGFHKYYEIEKIRKACNIVNKDFVY